MFDSKYGIYRSSDTEKIITAFISDVGNMVVLETHDVEKETVNEIVESLKESLKIDVPTRLDTFQEILEKELAPLKQDGGFSAACGLVVDNIIYVAVMGGGRISVYRDGALQQIIEGDTNASGTIQEGDVFVYTTKTFAHTAHGSQLTECLSKPDLTMSADYLSETVGEQAAGAACLLVSLQHKAQSMEHGAQDTEEPKREEPSTSRFNLHVQDYPRSKKITGVIVCVLLLVLAWSVVFGVARRDNEIAQKKIAASKEIITAKLEEATNVAPLNLERATLLIADAKNELEFLKKTLGKNHQKEVDELNSQITKSSNKIINKQDKSFEEFYDLSLIDKSASADTFYLSSDILSLLNSQKGEIYLVSVSKKSNNVIRKNEVKGSSFVATFQDTTFFLQKDKGIYTIDTDGKLKRPIDKEGFVRPLSFVVFNGNVYVLDSGSGDIYKYLVSDDGYSKKTSYFGSDQSGLIKGADDFAIDSSVYVLVDGTVIKYVSGEKDSFRLSLPDKSTPQFTHIFTNKDVDHLYLLDTKAGKVVVTSKTGEYEKQIESSIFKKASQFVVFDNKIIVLVGQKLFSVAL